MSQSTLHVHGNCTIDSFDELGGIIEYLVIFPLTPVCSLLNHSKVSGTVK